MPLLTSYLNAEYLPLGLPVGPLRVGRRTAELERCYPGVAHFAILTAWNPGSKSRPIEVNLAAQQALDKVLAAAGLQFIPALNRAPGGGHEEPSRLVFDAGDAQLDQLAMRFDQAGALAWDRGRAVRLRIYRPEWRAATLIQRMDTRFIDWVACARP
jgi:hypothetical protein